MEINDKPPVRRRWNQISLKGLLAIIVIAALASVAWLEYSKTTPVDGVWNGAGRHAGIQLAFHRGQVEVKNNLGSQFSRYKTAGDTIDIESEKGVQLGLYVCTFDRLELQVANFGEPRPVTMNVNKQSDSRSTYYVFDLDQNAYGSRDRKREWSKP